tara:strand:- start:97 stop:567 length:471 start_codon:yes stop_codon:yes gene_type:complete
MGYKRPTKKTLFERKLEFSEKFSNEINELRRIIHTCPRDEFVISMYNVLNSGSRPVTPKMYIAIQNIIKNNTPEKLEKKKEHIDTVIGKLMLLKEMIEVVDGGRISTGYSAYGFIMDIKYQAEKRMSLSRKQMEAVNKIYKKYKVRYDKKVDLEKN